MTQPGGIGSLTVDVNNSNVRIDDVTRLNDAVKAVVGANTWVNFTDEQIDPKLSA